MDMSLKEVILSHPYHKTVDCNNGSCSNTIGLISIPDSEFPDIVTILYVKDKDHNYGSEEIADLNYKRCAKCYTDIYHCSIQCYETMQGKCNNCPKSACSIGGCEKDELEECPDCGLDHCVKHDFATCNNCLEHICTDCLNDEGYCEICITENIF